MLRDLAERRKKTGGRSRVYQEVEKGRRGAQIPYNKKEKNSFRPFPTTSQIRKQGRRTGGTKREKREKRTWEKGRTRKIPPKGRQAETASERDLRKSITEGQ